MFFQFAIFVVCVAAVMGQDEVTSAPEVTSPAASTAVSTSINQAACQALYPNSTDVSVTETNDGCTFVCGTLDNIFSYFDVRTAPNDQVCGKEGNRCYQGYCYEGKNIETCRRITNGTEFTSITSNDCQVTCSSGAQTVATENTEDGKDCTPFIPVAGSQYECQSGSCVTTTFAVPPVVPPGGSFPSFSPIVVNPSRNPTKVPVPSPNP